MKKTLCLLLVVSSLAACKKSPSPAKPANNPPGCKIKSITSNDPDRTFPLQTFTYDSKGLMQSMEWLYTATQLYSHTDLGGVTSLSVGSLTTTEPVDRISGDKSISNVSFIFNGSADLPSGCTFDGTEFRNGTSIQTHDAMDYHFQYNDKQQLTKISESTPLANDNEWDVDIQYDQNGNVAQLAYSFSTGPRVVIPITVTGYDDKPNPFASAQYWKFVDQRWNIGDPRNTIRALSKNNPLKFEYSTTQSETFAYTYNDKGFPIALTLTRTIHPSETTSTYNESYVYDCP